jgi:hypothetical protein
VRRLIYLFSRIPYLAFPEHDPSQKFLQRAADCTFRLESVGMVAGHAAGVAAAMASRENSSVQKISVVDLQKRLRMQNQVIDFIPGQPEKCEHLNGPPEF